MERRGFVFYNEKIDELLIIFSKVDFVGMTLFCDDELIYIGEF